MPYISADEFKNHRNYVAALDKDRQVWHGVWQDLSNNFLPQRYRWLMSSTAYSQNRASRQYIINNTGTIAARTLTAGMINGITSPSRPWFKLRVPGLKSSEHPDLAVWLEQTEVILLEVMAASNFYNSMAVVYLDMGVFGTAANLIYEDFDNVIRCYNPPLGEYYLGTNSKGLVNIFARKLNYKIYQYIERWPDKKYWSDRVKQAVEKGGGALNDDIEIHHFIAPNSKRLVSNRFKYYEMYWEGKRQTVEGGQQPVLELRGYNELPGIFARWEVSGTDAYGVSPAMDALGDSIELQHLHRNKAELLEKMHMPPLLVDIALQNNPVALMPRGQTFVANLNNTSGARPINTVNPDFGTLVQDKQSIEERIKTTFYNYLFTGISDLPTVRSAEEIRSRESEKLILLGGVLERFETEGLDPAMKRIFSICDRAGLIPPLPEGYEDMSIDVQYVSILSVAQKAVGTAPTERMLGLTGNLAGIYPDAMDITDIDRMLINYARDIGIRESELRTTEQVAEIRKARQEAQQASEQMQQAPGMAQAAKTLSETDVGGGGDALNALMGG